MKHLPPILVSAGTVLILIGVIAPDLPDLWRPAHFMPPNVRRRKAMEAKQAEEDQTPPGREAQPDA
jgi:hypothetical protein